MGSYDDASDEVQEACFGAGAYWGTEKFFRELAGKKITLGVVGFMGSAVSKTDIRYDGVFWPLVDSERLATGNFEKKLSLLGV